MYLQLQRAPSTFGRTTARRSAPPTATARVLRLQRTAGNRAVGRLLARQPLGQLDRPELDDRELKNQVVDVSGIGEIPLASYSWSPDVRVRFEIDFTSATGPHSPELMRAAASGTKIDEVRLYMKARVMVLHDCYISSYRTGGSKDAPMDQWSVSFGRIEYENQ